MIDRATIFDAWDAEYTARKKFWIGGIPADNDLRALRRHIARSLRIAEEDVTKALAARQKAAKAQRGRAA